MKKNFFKIGKLKLWQKYVEKQQREHPLTYLFWETTLRCNLKCRHCGSSCGPDQKRKDELQTEEIKGVFKEISQDFDPQKIMVAVTGGESLLREDLFEVMEFASGLGFAWGMVTNGTLITPKIVSKLRRAGMRTVSVSLDGLQESNDWLRGKGAFKKAVRGIKLLVGADCFSVVEVITCVNQKNFAELQKIYKLCQDLGVTAWRLFVISPVGRAKGQGRLFLKKKQWRELLDFVRQKRRDKKTQIRVSFCEEGFLGPGFEGEVRDQLYYCAAGINVGSVLYNGEIASCPILPREWAGQGSVRKDRFAKVWSEKFKLFRDRSWCRRGKCRKCFWWDFCLGNSLHLWDFGKKTLDLCHLELLEET
jgi:radical SAM protein with 4Fe4S-binding SPASM domain